MAKSKWYNWLLNPVGALVNNLTDGKGAGARQINAVINPARGIKDAVDDIMARKKKERDKLSEIENEASELGMSLDEFLQANPIKAEQYERLESPVDKIIDKVEDNPHINSFIENVSGERDTQENQKNRDFQHQEAEIARNWEAEQAKQAREWDSIGAQMERAAAVGVNPVSIAMQNGGINGSLGTSIPASPGIPAGSSGLMHNGALDIASMIFNGIGTLAESRLKQTQSDDIVIMRQYNVAEKMATIDNLKKMGVGIDLSNVAQTIQNQWLDVMNQATYDGMLLENGVRRETIYEKRSIAKLNLQQRESIIQSMDLNLREFNAKLPLDLQLMESEIDLNKMSTNDIYSEICMRFLQMIEQENRNRQSSAEAGSAEVAEYVAKQTYEDAISKFHNDCVKSAADAGISLYDYQYYGSNYKSFFDWMGKTERAMFKNRSKRDESVKYNRSLLNVPVNVGQ